MYLSNRQWRPLTCHSVFSLLCQVGMRTRFEKQFEFKEADWWDSLLLLRMFKVDHAFVRAYPRDSMRTGFMALTVSQKDYVLCHPVLWLKEAQQEWAAQSYKLACRKPYQTSLLRRKTDDNDKHFLNPKIISKI